MSNQKFNKPKTPEAALIILGLAANQNPTVDGIKAAYKKKALEHHPDRNVDNPTALAKFLEASYAYEMLTNPDFRMSEEAYENRDLNVVTGTVIRFEDGFFGKVVRVFVNFIDPVFTDHAVASDGVKVDSSVHLTPVILTVPPGTIKMEFRFPGKGLQKDGSAGDLILQIQTQPHPVYQMDQQRNVHSQVRVPLRTMLQGGEVDVQTMYGIKRLVVPAGTQPEEKLILKKLGPGKLGHHLVTVLPDYPSKDELKNHDAWKKIDIHWDVVVEPEDAELEAFRGTFGRYKI